MIDQITAVTLITASIYIIILTAWAIRRHRQHQRFMAESRAMIDAIKADLESIRTQGLVMIDQIERNTETWRNN